MKPKTKLAIRSLLHVLRLQVRKRGLMALRALLWHADEWLHRQEIALRQDAATCPGKGSLPRMDLGQLGLRGRSSAQAPAQRPNMGKGAARPFALRRRGARWARLVYKHGLWWEKQ
jgi:hypothetical protein